MKKQLLSTLLASATLLAVTGCSPGDTPGKNGAQPQAIEETSISGSELALRNAMRVLWSDHVALTRSYIVSVAADLGDKDVVAKSLLQNQEDIGDAVKPYFGDDAGEKLTVLLREHIMIATEVLAAAKSGDAPALEVAKKKWSTNADQIADFLSAANPESWKQDEMRAMMQEHLQLTTDEAVSRLQGKWSEDLATYERVQSQALHMADMLSDGVVAKFPDKF